MTETITAQAERVTKWSNKAFYEYVRDSRFKRYMGSSENAIIQVNKDLTKGQGDSFVFNLVGALPATYNDGSTQLVGNELALPNDGFRLTVGVVRQAVDVNNLEEQASAIDIMNAGKVQVMDLSKRILKNQIIAALGSINGVAFGTATDAEKNVWVASNSDRVLFGNAKSNYSATFATALNNILGTMTMTKEVVSLAKRIAQGAVTVNSDGIRPYKYGEDEETYVLFVGKNAYRDLKIDLETAQENARERSEKNPLWSGPTSQLWDGVVVREIPEISAFANTADTPVTVEPWYLCGSQALGIAWAQTLKATLKKEDDYGYRRGVGFQEIRGIGKILWGQTTSTPKDWGMVTGFVAAPADA